MDSSNGKKLIQLDEVAAAQRLLNQAGLLHQKTAPITQAIRRLFGSRQQKERPRTFNGYLVIGYSTVEILPMELLLCITDHLTAAARASLALTSTVLYHKLGSNSLDITDERSLFELLLLLERDGFPVKKVPCHTCRIYHMPQASLPSSGNACVIWTMAERVGKFQSIYLPENMHWNMVYAIMRSHRQRTYRYSLDMLASSKDYRVGHAQIRYTTRCLIWDGELILRTVIAMLPCHGDEQQQRVAAPNLKPILRSMNNCCGHVRWTEEFPQIWPEQKPQHLEPTTHRIDPWNEEKDGPDRIHILIRSRKCHRCFTSYVYQLDDLSDGSGRVVSLASYKILGRGESVSDPKWNTHLWHASTEKQPRLWRKTCTVLTSWCRARWRAGSCSRWGLELEPWCFEGLARG